jgi:hypothetical protein
MAWCWVNVTSMQIQIQMDRDGNQPEQWQGTLASTWNGPGRYRTFSTRALKSGSRQIGVDIWKIQHRKLQENGMGKWSKEDN